MGTPSLEPTGSWLKADLKGIHEYTYWIMPVAPVLQSVSFKIFGISLATGRALSIAFGLLSLLSWVAIVRSFTKSEMIGAMTAGFLAFDYTFLWGAADARMDIMCGGFGAVGLALYLLLREKRWNSALWLCNTCIALAVFTHPNGFVFFLAQVAMIAYFDRGRLRWHDLAALTPYVLLASAWGAYILQRPDYFVAQFVANAGAHGGLRWNGLLHPFEAFVNEIVIRYVSHYGRHPMWGGPVPYYALVIPFVYAAAFILLWALRPIRRADGTVALLLLCTLFFSFLTVVGLKLASYLVLILPLYAALLAVLVHRSRQTTIAPIGILLACVLLMCQAGVIASKIQGNRYAREYRPTIEFLRQHRSGPILADSYFGFDLGFDRVKDDARLGFIGGAKSDWVVVDYWYDLWWNELFPQQDPEAVAYTRMLLKNYRLVYNNGSFRVYRRSS